LSLLAHGDKLFATRLERLEAMNVSVPPSASCKSDERCQSVML